MKAFAFALLLIAAVAVNADDDRTLTIIKPDQADEVLKFEFVPKPPERRQAAARYYICPKDETLVRVTQATHTGDVKCPLDGTVMTPGRGRTSAYFLLQ